MTTENNNNLFALPPEKYFAPPSTWDRTRIRDAIVTRLATGRYLASEKYDGYWSRFVRQGDEGKQQSRTVSRVTGTYGEFQEKIPFIFDFLMSITTGDTILLGELHTMTRNVNDVKAILGSKPPKALARQTTDETKLRFYIFDVWYWNGQSFMNTPFEERAKFLTKTIKPILEQNKYIHFANFTEGESAMERLDLVLQAEGEGLVLQQKMGLPEPGKRTAWKSIKLKKELEADVDVFVIKPLPATREYNGLYLETWPFWEDLRTGHLLPIERQWESFQNYLKGEAVEPVSKNYYYNWPSAIECGVYDDLGRVVSVCAVSGLTDAVKQDIAENPKKYVRRALTITGMEFTEDYSIRHPRLLGFRDDITDLECTWAKIFDRDLY